MHTVIQCCEYSRHTAAAQIAYNNPWQIYTGGAGEGGGFQRNTETALENAQVDTNWKVSER